MPEIKLNVVGEDLSVELTPWGRIHVRNKRPAGVEKFASDRIAIFQHGATYGGEAFDIPFGGMSWMDYVAARGFDCYYLDLPGYGRSQRPSQMDEPADKHPPFMRTPDAATCLGAVVDFVRRRRGVEKVCLVGWSWGTAITSYYTSGHNDAVERLTLYAPVWDRSNSSPSPIHVEGNVGAYRTVDREATLKRRLGGLDEREKADIIPAGWFDQWWSAVSATDPKGGGMTVRAPNGVVLDGIEYWSAGKPLYEPARITVPLLVVVGEWDNDTPRSMAETVFPMFVAVPWKRLSVLGGGTHAMLMERNRILLYRTVQQFLEEPPPGPEALE
jgi:pimeloyl-ACP methyl ester carboxylesterase